MSALEVAGLRAHYGKSQVLWDVALRVGDREIVTLLGRNGAGKTTTLRSVMGLVNAHASHMEILGHSALTAKTHERVRWGVGYVPEGRRIFHSLTVEENLRVPHGAEGKWNLARIYELFPRLKERRRHKGRQLSGGEQEMVAIARALLVNPSLLILDEPSQGLAPLIVQEVFATLVAANQDGVAILLVEQNAHAALKVAERAYVLDKGVVVRECDGATLRGDQDLVNELTGVSGERWEWAPDTHVDAQVWERLRRSDVRFPARSADGILMP